MHIQLRWHIGNEIAVQEMNYAIFNMTINALWMKPNRSQCRCTFFFFKYYGTEQNVSRMELMTARQEVMDNLEGKTSGCNADYLSIKKETPSKVELPKFNWALLQSEF